MTNWNRRQFLASAAYSIVAVSPRANASVLVSPKKSDESNCWLDLCAPFILSDPAAGLRTQLILTADTFAGVNGFADERNKTNYEILLYDESGRALGKDGIAKRLVVPAMQAAVLDFEELTDKPREPFSGGMSIRIRPEGHVSMHASDLFSSAFLRWQAQASFDNVHANPDPRQWQIKQPFYYSMPVPALNEYLCLFSLFNPNDHFSSGKVVLHDAAGNAGKTIGYQLKPHSSLYFDLNRSLSDTKPVNIAAKKMATGANNLRSHGLLAVTNDAGTAKSFGYLMINQPEHNRFSVEHPIHQSVFTPQPAALPFDDQSQFKAQNVLYSPLLFNNRRIKNLTLQSRCYFGSGLPLAQSQWFYPFAIDSLGAVAWSSQHDEKFARQLPKQAERGIVKLGAGQCCQLDFRELGLAKDFGGAAAVAVTPDISHTMLKMEVRIAEWNAYAFTHFRPGLRSARRYQAAKERGATVTDYIIAGASIVKNGQVVQFDELLAVLNIDDQGIEAKPVVELFNSRGLLKRISLGSVPPFACRHYLLSELLPDDTSIEMLSLRLLDAKAALLMSAVHLDYTRRDLALDHGSDRFSTYLDYAC